MARLGEKEEREARAEVEKLPPELHEAHANNQRLLSYPESSEMLRKVEDHPDRDRLIAEAAENGNTGAMLLLAMRHESSGASQKAQYWSQRAYNSGSAEAAFMFGLTYMDTNPRTAYRYFKAAFDRRHVTGTYALVNLCRNLTPKVLGITDAELAETLAAAVAHADQMSFAEVHETLANGTHPVQFLNGAGIPWGTGTFFLVDWKGAQFAITAAHVIAASNANANDVRLLVPGQTEPIPFVKNYFVDFRDNSGEALDLHAWKLDRSEPTDVRWHAWNLNHFWKPASSLHTGQTIFVLGYPNTEDKVDFEERVMRRQPLIVRGKLGNRTVSDRHPVECAEFSTDVDGMSGSPVFAMFGGLYFFVGMAQWGGASARRLHFLDAAEIVGALDALMNTP